MLTIVWAIAAFLAAVLVVAVVVILAKPRKPNAPVLTQAYHPQAAPLALGPDPWEVVSDDMDRRHRKAVFLKWAEIKHNAMVDRDTQTIAAAYGTASAQTQGPSPNG